MVDFIAIFASMSIIQITFLVLFIVLVKGLALWDSAKAHKKGWFIALLITNTLGILPVIYLLFFRSDQKLFR